MLIYSNLATKNVDAWSIVFSTKDGTVMANPLDSETQVESDLPFRLILCPDASGW
jgi:hypothetical protein